MKKCQENENRAEQERDTSLGNVLQPSTKDSNSLPSRAFPPSPDTYAALVQSFQDLGGSRSSSAPNYSEILRRRDEMAELTNAHNICLEESWVQTQSKRRSTENDGFQLVESRRKNTKTSLDQGELLKIL